MSQGVRNKRKAEDIEERWRYRGEMEVRRRAKDVIR
jgi:hypothetical protein